VPTLADRVTRPPVDPAQLDDLRAAFDASGPQLPTFDAATVAAQLRDSFPYRVPVYRGDGIREGRAFRLEVGMGTLAVRAFDPARHERSPSFNPQLPVSVGRPGGTYEWMESHAVDVRDGIAGTAQWAGFEDPGDSRLRPRPPGRSVVREWSNKSRGRMLRAYAELDYAPMQRQPGVAAMVTLTYPGDWLTVAPSCKQPKRHLRLLMKRWAREFGYRPKYLWKQEFQDRRAAAWRRGEVYAREDSGRAPHFHLFVSVPARARDGRSFERWLSDTWAAVVGHPDPQQRELHRLAGTGVHFGPASRCTDGRRLAVYFLKHGTKTRDGKEYQHRPPAEWDIQADLITGEVLDDGGTGRFWGYVGLRRTRASVDLHVRDWYRIRRLLRRWARAQGRTVRGLGARGGNCGGWQLVNDGPGFAALLSRALAIAG
jgi:hypothetical protein